MEDASDPHWRAARLPDIAPVDCPCGQARRAFGDAPGGVATLHLTDISADARPHHHRHMTEIYLILEGEGEMELDGARVPARPMDGFLIPPGVRHRALGRMRVAITAIPAFDPDDEHFD